MFVLLVAACATPVRNYVPTVERFSRPPIGVETIASIGDELLSQGNISNTRVLTLNNQINIGGYTLHPGSFAFTGSDGTSDYFSFVFPGNASAWSDGTPYGALQQGILNDPPQSVEYIAGENKICVVTIFNVHSCRAATGVTLEEKTNVSSNSFQQTLLYNGRVGDMVAIGYREFSGSMARPAFSNEVQYDLSSSMEIAYRGARIEIIDANNTQIRYRVLSNFN